MREIKFRGKSLNTGEWVYGGYYNLPDCLKDNLRHIIVYQNIGPGQQTHHEPIDVNTLGQYVGVRDKHGKEVYEGDILKDNTGKIYKIVWGNDLLWLAKTNETHFNCYSPKVSEKSEIIGSIYDDSELLSS